jgi:DNA (cytosine-5)-methyltransferase 1
MKAVKQRRRNVLNTISLYTGAGGLDLGFEAAGFQTRVAVELDGDCVSTLRVNRPEWEIIHANVHADAATSAKILARSSLKAGDPDVLIGGPPCQPFSKSGYWARGDALRLDDPRADTLAAFFRVLRDTQPKAFLLENVPGLAFSKKDEGLRFIEKSIEGINRQTGSSYSMCVDLLRAIEHGVPQDRQRVFVVGARNGRAFTFPAPSHVAPPTLRHAEDDETIMSLFEHARHAGVKPFTRAWDAIGDLEDDDDPALRMSGKWADLLPSIPEGSNYLHHTDRGHGIPLFGWRRRYWSFLLKLAKRLPSWTIAAQPGPAIGPFHWKNRRLSANEMLRLQTFPRGYQIVGNLRSAQRQIGNAVPSALAERLALAIRHQLLEDYESDPNLVTLLPSRRAAVPSPEPIAAVPRKYHALAGIHEPHPGTGLGYAAQRRSSAG